MKFDFENVPEDHRCYQSDAGRFQNYPVGDCFFGVLTNQTYGLLPFDAIPDGAKGFHFYLGSSQQRLFDSFLGSEWPRQTERLSIGSSSDDLGTGLDYSHLTASLVQTEFPNLEVLELGVWQLFSNSHCLFGQVGEIEALSKAMPKLRRLHLYGNSTLQSPLSLPELEELILVVDDEVTGVNGGPVDQKTVSNLLSSNLPKLRELYVDVKIGNEDVCYSVPDSLLASDVFPNLTRVELVGDFRAGDRERLLESPSLRHTGQELFLDGMREI